MRRIWVVLVVLAGFVAVADAKRVMCACPARVVVPEHGTLMPKNGKVWIINGPGAVHYPMRVPLRELMGLDSFEPWQVTDGQPVRITPTDELDDTPPAAPADLYVSIVTDRANAYANVVSLSAHGAYDSDTALVRIDVYDNDGVVSLLTSRTRLFLCQPGFVLADAKVKVEVRAIDLAGNESEPFTTTVVRTFSTFREDRCGGGGQYDEDALCADGHCGHGHVGNAILLIFFVLGLITWLLVMVVRRATITRQLAEDVPLLVAEEVARRNVRWLFVWSAMLITAVVGLGAAGTEALPIAIAPFAVVNLVRLFLARSALVALDRQDASAVRHGRWLRVKTLRGSYYLHASEMDFAMAQRASVPRSIVR